MALPQDGQNANALATVKEVPTGKKLIFVDPTTNEGGIITLEDLTTQILKKLTSQTFALDQGTKTLPAALNELNSNTNLIYEDLGRFVSVSADVNTIFDAMNDESISIKRYSGESANTPESGSGIIITFKDVLSFGWNIAICNGKVYSRNIVNGNNGNWVLLS